MKPLSDLSTVALAVSFGMVAYSTSAHAYLDPGTGSIILQGLIAAVAAGLATGKLWWHRVKGFFVKTDEVDTGQSDLDSEQN